VFRAIVDVYKIRPMTCFAQNLVTDGIRNIHGLETKTSALLLVDTCSWLLCRHIAFLESVSVSRCCRPDWRHTGQSQS